MNNSIIGTSEPTKRAKQLMKSIAPSDGTVFITGESGCGKELYARAIHDMSSRHSKPFVPINCGAIPADLLESQLFGHKKGAFTGAVSDYKGKFEVAESGTLFLDEIGDMPFEMQVKLLRVLQEKNVTPVGSNRAIEIDVRVIAATHQDIELAMSQKRFREDLYYRLNVLPLKLAPLRQRREEIPELADFFSKQFALAGQKPILISPKFMKFMKSYDWPGNVRELANTMQRFSVLYPGQVLGEADIDPTMVPSGLAALMLDEVSDSADEGESHHANASAGHMIAQPIVDVERREDDNDAEESDVESIVSLAQGFPTGEQSLKNYLGEVEQEVIEKALAFSNGNVSKSARLLKIQRTTLIERIKKYNL